MLTERDFWCSYVMGGVLMCPLLAWVRTLPPSESFFRALVGVSLGYVIGTLCLFGVRVVWKRYADHPAKGQ